MNLEQYNRIHDFFITHSSAFSLLLMANRFLNACGFFSLPAVIVISSIKRRTSYVMFFYFYSCNLFFNRNNF